MIDIPKTILYYKREKGGIIMKKLLALLLCAILFTSVLSAAAFAATDLSPAYEALDNLNNAYAQLAGATVFKIAYDGFHALAGTFKPGSDAGEVSEMMAAWYAACAGDAVDSIRKSGSGLSYENLFALLFLNDEKTLGGDLYDSYYEFVGLAVAYDVRDSTNEMAMDIGSSAADMIARLG